MRDKKKNGKNFSLFWIRTNCNFYHSSSYRSHVSSQLFDWFKGVLTSNWLIAWLTEYVGTVTPAAPSGQYHWNHVLLVLVNAKSKPACFEQSQFFVVVLASQIFFRFGTICFTLVLANFDRAIHFTLALQLTRSHLTTNNGREWRIFGRSLRRSGRLSSSITTTCLTIRKRAPIISLPSTW